MFKKKFFKINVVSWPLLMDQKPTQAGTPPWADPLLSLNKIRFVRF
jgi:hypothetical protein